MQSKRALKTELHTLTDLKTIIGSYQEIAALRMRKVKKSVLQNRAFLDGLANIYQRVLITYNLATNAAHINRKKKSVLTLRKTNGKTVSVLVSSNTGLYGDIVKRTFDLFVNNVMGNSHDVVIIGRRGRQMYDNTGNKRVYQYFEVSDSGTDSANVREILDYILQYDNVVVYHGIYQSILDQKATATFVTGELLNTGNNNEVTELKCLIEPSIEEVLSFFEKQISSSLFEQTLHEASLSKFSSRMVSLDMASDNIRNSIKKVRFAELKVMHKINNLQQMERLSGIALWK